MLISGLFPYLEAGKKEKRKDYSEGVVRFLALQAGLPGTELRV